MRLNRIALVIVFLFGLSTSAFAIKTTMQCKIMQVKDGDTVVANPIEEARAKKLGLWRDSNPTPPWEFRKMQRDR